MTERRDPDRCDRRQMLPRDGGRRVDDAPATRRAPDMEKIACPVCDDGRSRVINSRPFTKRDGIWRERRCLKCGHRYTTQESLAAVNRAGDEKKSHVDVSPDNI